MNNRLVIFILILAGAMLLNGCTAKIVDTNTEQKISELENPDPSYIKEEIKTDGMLADIDYGGQHPFSMGNEVWVDTEYYVSNEISRGDIVVFKTKNKIGFPSDIARIVGLPGETVQVKKGTVYIDGKKLDAFYGEDSTSVKNDSMAKPLHLSDEEYFILADVRWRGFNDSQSESAAFVKDEIVGKVIGYEKK